MEHKYSHFRVNGYTNQEILNLFIELILLVAFIITVISCFNLNHKNGVLEERLEQQQIEIQDIHEEQTAIGTYITNMVEADIEHRQEIYKHIDALEEQ